MNDGDIKKYSKNQNSKEMDILAKKIERVSKMEKEFWEKLKLDRDLLKEYAPDINMKFEKFFPYNLSSKIYAFNDGIIFLRYLTINNKNKFEHNMIDADLDIADDYVSVPTNKGDFYICKMIPIGPGSEIRIIDSTFGEVKIEWLWLFCYQYNDKDILEEFQEAIIDYKIYITGILSDPNFLPKNKVKDEEKHLLRKLEELKKEFEMLLSSANKEEEVQQFLNEHTILIQPYSKRISKQKLGDDWITDYVLMNLLSQGRKYTFVEIEKPSMRIITRNNQFAQDFNHAQKQIQDWDNWLETNKAYIQNKLKGFESPEYIIIGGRTKDLTEENKNHIRSWNRRQKDLTFLSYDDLIIKLEELIKNLKTV